MLVLILALAFPLIGFGLIILIARFSPNVPRTAPLVEGEQTDARPQITGDEFKDLLEELVDSLGMHVVFSSMGTGGVVEMILRDPTPLSGGRILLEATPVLQGQVDAAEALGFAEGVRADMGALKGILIALAGFTDEAKAGINAAPAPVDLLDGAQLLELLEQQLEPERAAFASEHRGFGHR